MARRAEQLGYDCLYLGDHLFTPAPLPALVIAAEATSRLRVGTRVINAALAHPVRLAWEAATLDLLTGGRFELGVGAGWDRADFEAMGRTLPPLAVRVRRLDACLQAVRTHWTDTCRCPHPPITVGGQSDALLSVAGRHADAVELTGMATSAARQRIRYVSHSEVVQRVAVLRRAAGDRASRIEVGIRAHTVLIGAPAAIAARSLAALSGVPGEIMVESPFALVGTVEEIVAKVESFRRRLGILRYTVDAAAIDELAPVVSRLAS